MTEVHIGKNIQSLRRLLGIKQETFARKMGMAQQNISRLEKRKMLSHSKLKAVAQALEVSVEIILTFDEENVLNIIRGEKVQESMSLKEIIDYFKEEIAKRDRVIEELRSRLNGADQHQLTF